MPELESQSNDSNDVYVNSRLPLKRTIGAVLLLLFFGFFLNFPISEIISKNVAKTISSIRGCPISYNKIDVEYFFFPKVILKKPTISGLCFGNPSEKMSFDELLIKLYIPGFLPPGVRFHIPIESGKTAIDTYLTIGLGSVHVNVKDSNVNGQLLSKLSPMIKNISGDLSVNVLADLDKKGPTEADILIKSSNFKLGAQNVMGLLLPEMNLGNVNIKAEFKKPKLNLISFKIGKNNSPIQADLKGNINYNAKYPKGSKLNLKGTIFFSQEFISDFPILNVLLAGKKANSKGAYNITLTGTLGAPKHQFK